MIYSNPVKEVNEMLDIEWYNALAWVSIGWITYLPINYWIHKRGKKNV